MKDLPLKTRRAALLAAGVILLIAVIWLIILESNSYVRAACRSVNRFGYNTAPSDFYLRVCGTDTSVVKLTGRDCSEISELSKRCGFGGDADKTGKIELMLWNMDDDNVMYVYLVDKKPEIVFIEELSSGKVKSIDTK